MKDIEAFKNEQRKRQKYQEGDIFCFKLGRREYGFGKIIIDIVKRRKKADFINHKNYDLSHLMGTALIVKIYHKISDTPDIDINGLEKLSSFPLQSMMDNKIFHNEYKIIGNMSVSGRDLNDSIISVSPSISGTDPDIAYLQYGLIYKEIPIEKYKKYQKEHWVNYRNESIGFSFFIENFEECIREQSNQPYFDANAYDLRNLKNQKDKQEIFELFGLDADLDYVGNLKMIGDRSF
ncbi:MAG: immunity 26/phosphotriesterase HocA family protein [Neisseria sp.]|nr:immunity 26/phosphotriesterase HocA family protein [Neisseria sp.]